MYSVITVARFRLFDLVHAGFRLSVVSMHHEQGLKMNKYLIISISIVITGCSMPYSPAKIEPENAKFYGVHPVSMGSTETDLIMIHGMCHHDASWVIDSRNNLADKFHMDYDKKITVERLKERPFYEDPKSKVAVYKTKLTDHEFNINLYGIVFGTATLPIKQNSLCKDISKQPNGWNCLDKNNNPSLTYNRDRVILNEVLKNTLLNDCLADAVIYSGETGEAIRDGVKNAMSEIYKDRINSKAPVALISESLGSKILRDALVCNIDEKTKQGLSLVSEAGVIFLGANQIPILSLANNLKCSESAKFMSNGQLNLEMKGGFSDVFKIIKTLKSQNGEKRFIQNVEIPKTVVSFTDPNDLLSYEIDELDYYENSSGISVVNVIASNAKSWFGLIENPLTAHTGYRYNEDVTELLKCGFQNKNIELCESK
jgi:hypothetical protein